MKMQIKHNDNRWFWLYIIITAFMGFLYMMIVDSCSPAKTSTNSETINQQIEQTSAQQSHINIIRDTIHTRDSVIIRQKNDTVYFDRWHVTYKAQRIADTVFIAVHDSIVRCDTVRLQQTATITPKKKPTGIIVWLVVLLALWFAAYRVKKSLKL